MYKVKNRGSTISVICENIHEITVPEKSPIDNEEAADFEQAISATKFGKFNLLLILTAIPAGWSSISETTSMSYVFPAAQCDLDLNLGDKGLLNAITYVGMISSAFFWGYLCDTLGRKKILFIGYFLDALFVWVSSISQNFTVLMIMKYFGGFIINGPFAALTCYLSEFHCAKYRARTQMVLGIIFSAGTICLPLLAGIVLPSEINFYVFNYLRIHSWNVYLFILGIPTFIAGIVFMFLPESPKFLMTSGQNEKAMEVLRLVYSINTGKSKDSYPIKMLVNERKSNDIPINGQTDEAPKKSARQALAGGLEQLKPLFLPPFLQKMVLVCGLQMLIMMSLNTLRLWLPQLFQAINDYQYYHNGTSADLCTMLDVIRPKNVSNSTECFVNTNNTQVYVNSMIVSAATLLGYVVAGSLINFLGKKKLLFILGIIAGISGCSLYLTQSITTTLILTSLYVAVASVCINVLLSAVVDLFPTTLRTMTVSLTMMFGRLGAMGGNLVFPYLLKAGCAPPFLTIGTGMLSCAFISILLPNSDMKSLQ